MLQIKQLQKLIDVCDVKYQDTLQQHHLSNIPSENTSKEVLQYQP